MMPQGHPANWTPLPSHAGFNYQNLPSPGLNHSTIQGCSHKVILPPYSHRQLKLLNSVTITGYFRKLSRMGRTDRSHGMGNNGGYGQPGMLGNLLTVGKGTMNGIGMLSSLMGMGKFFLVD